MHWDRFDKSPAPRRGGGKAAAPALTDQNRHLRELNAYGPASERRNRRQIPRQLRSDLDQQLTSVLESYRDEEVKRDHSAEMKRLLSKVIQTQNEFVLSAERLDASPRTGYAVYFQPVVNAVIFLFDWVLLSVSFFILFSSITEKWRPAPETTLLYGLSSFIAFMCAAAVKQLAKYAVLYGWARFAYLVPWAGAATADLYYLNKQGNLNVGLLMSGFLAALAGVTYFHARYLHEQPPPRKQLLLDYADKYDLFSQHYFHWEKTIRSMRLNKELAVVSGDNFLFENPAPYEPEQESPF